MAFIFEGKSCPGGTILAASTCFIRLLPLQTALKSSSSFLCCQTKLKSFELLVNLILFLALAGAPFKKEVPEKGTTLNTIIY